ncbi:MAG: AMIN domain-containing protein [bacterium]
MKKLTQLYLIFTLIILPALAMAAMSLMDIKVSEEDAKIRINIITDKPMVKYNSFTADKPPAIVIELDNTQCAEKELIIGRNGINRINCIPQEGPKTKIVISIIKVFPYEIQQVKNGLEVIIDNPYHSYQLNKIDVKEDESKINLLISSSAPPQYKYFDLANPTRIIVDFLNATNKIGEIKTTSKFIKNITPGQRQTEPVKVARVMVELTEFMPYQVFSDENQVTLELTKYPLEEVKKITPVSTKETPKEILPEIKITPPIAKKLPTKEIKEKEKPALPEIKEVKKPVESKPVLPKIKPEEERKEEMLSLDFKDADILDVLRIIAHKVGMNVLPGKEVKGVVTVKLENVSWRKALDLILRNSGYAYIIDDNIIRVDIPTLLLGETTTRIFKLNYAKASEMAGIVTNMMTTLSTQQAKQMGGAAPMLGTVIQDARTNALIVTDIPYNVNQVAGIIEKLDTITPQVMIEAKIVEVTLDTRNMFGFMWSMEDKRHNFAIGSYQTEGWAMGDRGEFLYSKLTSGHNIEAILNGLVVEGKANVLSTPKILALDNEKAEILVGEDVPYQQTQESEQGKILTSVSFRQVGIKLAVTPHINPDNYILLDVKPEVSSLKEWAYQMPLISTKQATSKLVVKDGDTVVIGGIIDDQGTEKLNKVPFFGDLPFVGSLFRKKLTENRKIELLIFITPTIIKPAI